MNFYRKAAHCTILGRRPIYASYNPRPVALPSQRNLPLCALPCTPARQGRYRDQRGAVVNWFRLVVAQALPFGLVNGAWAWREQPRNCYLREQAVARFSPSRIVHQTGAGITFPVAAGKSETRPHPPLTGRRFQVGVRGDAAAALPSPCCVSAMSSSPVLSPTFFPGDSAQLGVSPKGTVPIQARPDTAGRLPSSVGAR